MPADIILIGPSQAGKSTLGRLLAEKLDRPQYSLDQLRWTYYREIGYDHELSNELRRRGGFVARVLYWSLFNAYAIERLLSEHRDGVFDLGAGPLTFESDELVARVRRALEPYPNVVMILPSPDPDESIRILSERLAREPAELNFDFASRFVRHPANHALAKFTVYTRDKTPEETRDEIIRLTAA